MQLVEVRCNAPTLRAALVRCTLCCLKAEAPPGRGSK
jgi:hypothetical protein